MELSSKPKGNVQKGRYQNKALFYVEWHLNARPHLVLFINHSRRLVSARTNLNARVGKARKSGGDKQTFNDLPHDEAHALLFL